MHLSRGVAATLNIIRRFLAKYGPNGCWFGQDWLAKRLKRTTRTIQRWIAALRKAGLIHVRRRYKRTNVYSLVQPKMSSKNVASELPSGVSVNLRRERMVLPTVVYEWPRRVRLFFAQKQPKPQIALDATLAEKVAWWAKRRLSV